jgi:hypothetical protein
LFPQLSTYAQRTLAVPGRGTAQAALWSAAGAAAACHWLSPGYPSVIHNVVHKLCA